MEHLSTIILIIFLACISIFFSASETSIIGLSKIRLRHMVAQGAKNAGAVQHLVTNSDTFITAILVGNNVVNIAISAMITGMLVQSLGYEWGVFVSTVLTALVILILCEITPKILAMKHAQQVASFSAPLMAGFIRIFRPVIDVFTNISSVLLKIIGVNIAGRSPLITEEELRLMIEVGREEGVLSDEERKMLHRIFEFGDTRLRDVMVPKEKVTGIDARATPDQLLDIFAEEGHSRLPVYEGSIDNIIGIIYARDLLYIMRDKGLFLVQDLIREACYVKPAMRVNDLLRRFQADKIQIAVVVDEQKKMLGMVTLEDLVEEIVGELEEKHHMRRA